MKSSVSDKRGETLSSTANNNQANCDNKPQTRKNRQAWEGLVLGEIDLVPPNVRPSRQAALLFIFEDNESVIKMVIKARNPTKRHVSCIHRVALDWLLDRIHLCQLADFLAKGSFSRKMEQTSQTIWHHEYICVIPQP